MRPRSWGGRKAVISDSKLLWGAADPDKIRTLAKELVDLRPDVIFDQTTPVTLALEASIAAVHGRDEIEGVIAAQARNPGGGLLVMPDVFNDANRELIIALAARSGVPAIYPCPVFAESGGLIAYGANLAEQFRQAPGYIDRILKGANPGDLPIQQPTKFELVINVKTAKALGLSVPQSMLLLADGVIE